MPSSSDDRRPAAPAATDRRVLAESLAVVRLDAIDIVYRERDVKVAIHWSPLAFNCSASAPVSTSC
jgi:hypothetical protein